MKKYFFYLALIYGLMFTNKTFALNDSCLHILGSGFENYYNPDKVKIDSCVNSLTFGKWYAKKTFIFFTNAYIFQDKPILLSNGYTWQDLDTSFPTIRNAFRELEKNFGPYFFKRFNDGINDSDHIRAPGFTIEFKNYVPADSVSTIIFYIDSVSSCELLDKPGLLNINEPTKTHMKITFNQGKTLLTIELLKKLQNNNFIKIYNIQGICLLERRAKDNDNIIQIDIASLKTGVYILNINYQIFKFFIMR